MINKILAWAEAFAPHIIAAILILLAGKILSKVVIKIMSRGLNSKHIDKTAHTFIMSIVKTLISIFSLIIALSALNVPMSSIVATVGAAGLAIGLALQSSLSNVAGGFIILFAQPFKSGDYVEIGSVSGTVNAISILYTRILTADNKAIHIPNGTVASATVINYTEENIRRLDLNFDISYESDYDKAVEVIKQVINASEHTLHTPNEPFVAMSQHGSSSITITAKTWVASENYWALNFYLIEQVKKAFDANGISIPYNHLDVNLVQNDSNS